jgi:FKBP12-rapamycin complex-associated protein
MEAMRQHSPNLVEQAGLVSHELIRIAVLWHEQWHEGLEEASRLYFGDHNIEGMLATLEPLHEMLRKGPETLREISFIQSFGRDLAEAKDWCEAYKTTREIGDLNQVSNRASYYLQSKVLTINSRRGIFTTACSNALPGSCHN